MSRSSLIEGLLVTLVVTGDFKGLVPPADQVWIGQHLVRPSVSLASWQLEDCDVARAIGTDQGFRINKGQACGLFKTGDESSTPPVNATGGPAPDVAMSMSKTAIRFRAKAATPRRRLFSTWLKRISSLGSTGVASN